MQVSLTNIYQLVIVFTTMTITGSIGLALRIVSLGLLTNFNRRYFIPFSSRITMWLVGIKLDLPNSSPLDGGHYFITFNHNSYLDIFALTALGYTNTVFLLSEKTIKIIPVTISALSIGTLYIPEKKHKTRRNAFFRKIENKINKSKLNVAGSSEGVHEHRHGIDKFNKGVYLMALKCKMNIIPLFINVPKESNPFNKYKQFKRGTIKIEILKTVGTDNWKEENLDLHIQEMRQLYVDKFNSVNNDNIQ